MRNLWKNTWLKIALSLGIVASITAASTFAYWNSSLTMNGGTFNAGSLVMSVDGNVATFTNSGMTMTTMMPGESKAFAVTVKNENSVSNGNAPINYMPTITQGGTWTYTGTVLTVRAYAGAVNTNTGTYPRTGTCTGTALSAAPVAAAASPANIFTIGRDLAPQASESICLLIAMDQNAPNANQNQSGTLKFDFTGTQKAS